MDRLRMKLFCAGYAVIYSGLTAVSYIYNVVRNKLATKISKLATKIHKEETVVDPETNEPFNKKDYHAKF